MPAPNNIQKQLEKMGIKSMIPSAELLTLKLNGMSLRRFNKILANTSSRELTGTEARDLTRWLASLTNQPESAITLWEAAAAEVAE